MSLTKIKSNCLSIYESEDTCKKHSFEEVKKLLESFAKSVHSNKTLQPKNECIR